ncbi:uncharacterized protein LOC113310393 isoform X2 [Papaver somniferum]|uniref:uncharacterized protein LOC113310393 isoform X2 n=1 Tax=Papaver somniferum TaxID=3469 RepID=UPI000E700D1E|nr:uncharacterized protein LOC113310393 isoform X2 [Papaver somniferum]
MQYCSEVVQGRVDKTLHLWEKVQKLHDPQMGDGAGFGLFQQRLAMLPIKVGGFGIYTLNDTVHCAGEVGQKFRHYVVKDVLADMCYKAGVVARKEVSLGFSSNNVYSLRPADILFYNWEDGKDVCMDVTGVSPFTSARTRNFTPGHAISATVTRKRDKYLDTCTAQGYGFVVLAFSTLGELGSEMISFLQRLRNCLVSHDANHKIGDSLFFRLGVVIQKGIGAQLVARIPAPNV